MPGKILLYYNDLVFQPSESFLFKDFGQVAYVLAELFGCEVEYWIAAAHPRPGFDVFRGKTVRQFGKRFRRLPARLDPLKNTSLYHAIDKSIASHLMIYPFTPTTDYIVARHAKRRGMKIIMKLDTNKEYLNSLKDDWAAMRSRSLRVLRQSWYYRELLELADLVICEAAECERILRNDFLGLDLSGKLVRTYNGLSEEWLKSIGVDRSDAVERTNSIVVSGRISSRQKYSELIFEAGPLPPGWSIDFIGEVDEAFHEVVQRYAALIPDFHERYRFHGAIDDKQAYFRILRRARALLMNSRGGEGFPNVFADAHYCGLLIVTSDVSGARDATCDGRFGILYEPGNAAALEAALQAIPARAAALERDPDVASFRSAFIWERSLDRPAVRALFHDAARPDPATR